jgi:hypothetical protein
MNMEMSPQEGAESVKKMPPPMTEEEIKAMGKGQKSKRYLFALPDGTTATAENKEEEKEIRTAWDAK